MHGELVHQADDLILHQAQPLGAAAAVAVLQQQVFGRGAAFDQRGLEPFGHRGAEIAFVAGMRLGERVEVGRDGARNR